MGSQNLEFVPIESLTPNSGARKAEICYVPLFSGDQITFSAAVLLDDLKANVSNARLIGAGALVIDEKSIPADGFFFHSNHLIKVESIDFTATRSSRKSNVSGDSLPSLVAEEYFFLGGWKGIHFGHWVFEIAPRLHHVLSNASYLSPYTLVVEESVPSEFLGFINFITGGKNKILRIDPHNSPIFESLTISRCPFFRSRAHSQAIAFDRVSFSTLLDRFQSLSKIAQVRFPEYENSQYVLLISRPEQARRRCLNTEAIYDYLTSLGMRVMWQDHIELLSYHEQLALVLNASFVVEEAGSSIPFTLLANRKRVPHVVFCSSKYSGVAIRTLASLLGQYLNFLVGEFKMNSRTWNPVIGDYEYDFSIDVAQLKRTIQEIIAAKKNLPPLHNFACSLPLS